MKAVATSLTCTAALLIGVLPLHAQAFQEFIAVSGPVTALTNAKVIDGTGAPARTGQTILIEGNRITAVGSSISIPAGANRVDLAGHTVIPGLIGLHNHSYYTCLLYTSPSPRD